MCQYTQPSGKMNTCQGSKTAPQKGGVVKLNIIVVRRDLFFRKARIQVVSGYISLHMPLVSIKN